MDTNKIRVYIASPYTVGDAGDNLRRHMQAADTLIGAGFAPFIPLLYHFQHISFPNPYEVWMSLDLTWVKQCNYLLRLEGGSSGADREVAFAKAHGIPVFYSVEELVNLVKLVKYEPMPAKVREFLHRNRTPAELQLRRYLLRHPDDARPLEDFKE